MYGYYYKAGKSWEDVKLWEAIDACYEMIFKIDGMKPYKIYGEFCIKFCSEYFS